MIRKDTSAEDVKQNLTMSDLDCLKKVPKPGWFSRNPVTGKIGPSASDLSRRHRTPEYLSAYLSLIRMLCYINR